MEVFFYIVLIIGSIALLSYLGYITIKPKLDKNKEERIKAQNAAVLKAKEEKLGFKFKDEILLNSLFVIGLNESTNQRFYLAVIEESNLYFYGLCNCDLKKQNFDTFKSLFNPSNSSNLENNKIEMSSIDFRGVTQEGNIVKVTINNQRIKFDLNNICYYQLSKFNKLFYYKINIENQINKLNSFFNDISNKYNIDMKSCDVSENSLYYNTFDNMDTSIANAKEIHAYVVNNAAVFFGDNENVLLELFNRNNKFYVNGAFVDDFSFEKYERKLLSQEKIVNVDETCDVKKLNIPRKSSTFSTMINEDLYGTAAAIEKNNSRPSVYTSYDFYSIVDVQGFGNISRFFTVHFKSSNDSSKTSNDLWFEVSKRIFINKKEKSTTNSFSKYDELKKLKDLLDSGVITQEEFETEKRKLLN